MERLIKDIEQYLRTNKDENKSFKAEVKQEISVDELKPREELRSLVNLCDELLSLHPTLVYKKEDKSRLRRFASDRFFHSDIEECREFNTLKIPELQELIVSPFSNSAIRIQKTQRSQPAQAKDFTVTLFTQIERQRVVDGSPYSAFSPKSYIENVPIARILFDPREPVDPSSTLLQHGYNTTESYLESSRDSSNFFVANYLHPSLERIVAQLRTG